MCLCYYIFMNACNQCATVLKNDRSTYCSNKCQKDHEYGQYISDWKQGLKTGNRGSRAQNLSSHLIRYIFQKYDSKCAQCTWAELNPITNKSPLEIDHIDGNSLNNDEMNLILLCPNCHSLTSTYKNLNKGYGRGWRREKYVKIV